MRGLVLELVRQWWCLRDMPRSLQMMGAQSLSPSPAAQAPHVIRPFGISGLTAYKVHPQSVSLPGSVLGQTVIIAT